MTIEQLKNAVQQLQGGIRRSQEENENLRTNNKKQRLYFEKAKEERERLRADRDKLQNELKECNKKQQSLTLAVGPFTSTSLQPQIIFHAYIHWALRHLCSVVCLV